MNSTISRDRAGRPSRPQPLVRGVLTWLAAVIAAGAAPALHSAEPATGQLRLRDDSTLTGRLLASPSPGLIRWQPAAFASPLEFPLTAVSAATFSSTDSRTPPAGQFGFELAGGNVVYGDLVALDDREVAIRLGYQEAPAHIDRRRVHRIVRLEADASLLYLGPNGIDGWSQPPAGSGARLRDESGQLTLEGDGESASKVNLPPQASCEVELSWKGAPDFALEFGVAESSTSSSAPPRPQPGNDAAGFFRGSRPFALDVINEQLVALGETDTEADLIPLEQLDRTAGRLRMLVYLDQTAGRFIVFDPAGRELANLNLPRTNFRPESGIRLINRQGTVRIERLRVCRWNGEPPHPVAALQSRLHRTDGSIEYGTVERFDPGTNTFLLLHEGRETRLSAAETGSVFLSPSTPVGAEGVAISGNDGSRLSGSLVSIDETSVRLHPEGVREPVTVPMTLLRSLQVLSNEAPQNMATPQVPGTLQVGDDFLKGWLVDAQGSPEAGCLVWHPTLGTSAAPLRTDIAGRIVYHDGSPPAAKASPRRPAQRGGADLGAQIANQLAAAMAGRNQGRSPGVRKIDGKFLLHLRTGDTIPCKSVTIDEAGVQFESTTSDATRVAHERIKVLELSPSNPDEVKLKKSKRERLLTLPRIQRPSPPTQLLRSNSGDFLRGRVTAMTDEAIELEVRLENRTVPRSLVSHIFWLHPEELDSQNPDVPAGKENAQLRVQAYRNDGFRLTFQPQQVAAGVLTGTSDVLGSCRVELARIDQLIIGSGIEQSVAQLAYHRWKLKNAVDPRYVGEGDETGGGGGDSGTGSSLVGKPAPDFQLDLLDGSRFQLSAQRGKIVVLDFWATWCGPCLRAMPQVEAAVNDFPKDQVQLIAVNLQEQPKQISAMLERQRLDVTVALDVDGVVAERYEANAIPQTVIIDRDGKIARLYVGGHTELGDNIREAVRSLLEPAP